MCTFCDQVPFCHKLGSKSEIGLETVKNKNRLFFCRMTSYGDYKRQREDSRNRDHDRDRDRSRSYGDRDRGRDDGYRSSRPPPPKRGRGGPAFQRSDPSEPRTNSEVQIFVQYLPIPVRESDLEKYFSTVGEIKEDKMTKKKRIWIYKEADGKTQKGECTITYRDTETQRRALDKYQGEYFMGQQIDVTPSVVKPHMAKPPPPSSSRGRGGGRGRGGRGFGRGGGRGGNRGGGGSNANYEALGPRRDHGGGGSYGDHRRRDSYGSSGDRRDSYGSSRDGDRRDSYGSSSRYR